MDIQLLYICQGTIAVFGNCILVIAFSITKQLRRKENLFIVGIALADVGQGIAFLSAGLYRLGIFSTGVNRSTLLTTWDCMKLPQNWFFLIGGISAAGMHAMVSIDRLIAIKWLGTYAALGKQWCSQDFSEGDAQARRSGLFKAK